MLIPVQPNPSWQLSLAQLSRSLFFSFAKSLNLLLNKKGIWPKSQNLDMSEICQLLFIIFRTPFMVEINVIFNVSEINIVICIIPPP